MTCTHPSTRTRIAVLLAAAGLASAVSAQTPSTADFRTRLKANMVTSCNASATAKGGEKSAVESYCTCVAEIVDTLDDTEFLDLVATEARNERPKNETFLKILSKAETCKASPAKPPEKS